MRFQEIIDEESSTAKDIKLLPLCHTTTEGYFDGIKEKKFVDLRMCANYKEQLVYFFYGKASYKTKEKEIQNYSNNPPITLIYESELLDPRSMKRMLPFDSGGYERYHIKEGYEKSSFTHENPNKDAIKGLIKLLYDSNDHYLNDEVNKDKLLAYTKKCWPINEIIELYKRVEMGDTSSGDQVYAIELQLKDKIDFKPKHIVIPYTFVTSAIWDETDFLKQFPTVGVKYYGEEKIHEKKGKALSGSEYQDLMRETVMGLIK